MQWPACVLCVTDYQSALNSPEDLYKEIYLNMSQFREPPPYPGLPKHSEKTGMLMPLVFPGTGGHLCFLVLAVRLS